MNQEIIKKYLIPILYILNRYEGFELPLRDQLRYFEIVSSFIEKKLQSFNTLPIIKELHTILYLDSSDAFRSMDKLLVKVAAGYLGSHKSPLRIAASTKNGKKGGRPRLK